MTFKQILGGLELIFFGETVHPLPDGMPQENTAELIAAVESVGNNPLTRKIIERYKDELIECLRFKYATGSHDEFLVDFNYDTHGNLRTIDYLNESDSKTLTVDNLRTTVRDHITAEQSRFWNEQFGEIATIVNTRYIQISEKHELVATIIGENAENCGCYWKKEGLSNEYASSVRDEEVYGEKTSIVLINKDGDKGFSKILLQGDDLKYHQKTLQVVAVYVSAKLEQTQP